MARARATRGSVAAAAAGACLLVALAGCVAIPTSGPINTGDVVLTDPGPAIDLANDPPPDGTPEEIVNGFLSAGAAGVSDEFVVARKFLDPATAARWDPTARVLVYPLQGGGPEIEVREDGTAVVSVPVEGSLDGDGVYTEAPTGAQEELSLELRRNADGQWRISALDDVVLMSASSFANLYRRMPVYFASLDGEQLVPEVRWFPTVRIATAAVRALLAGPSAWLRDVVQTGAPDGTQLGIGAVTVTDQVATVALSAEAGTASESQRNLLLAQLDATLERVPGAAVSDVLVTVGDGGPWASTATTVPVRDVSPPNGPYVLAEGQLSLVEDGVVRPVDDAADLTGRAVHDPAVSLDEQVRVVLEGAGQLLALPTGGDAPTPLFSGTALLAPSIDRFDWVWTGERAPSGGLTAVSADGEAVPVAVDWLDGRSVRSMRVSRDGDRVVVVHTGVSAPAVAIDVAAVVRDETGRPQRLGDERLQIGAGMDDATQVVWVDEGTVAVLGRSGSLTLPTIHLVPVGGPSAALTLVDGTESIAAGRGDRSLYLTDTEGTLRSRQGTSWVVVATDVRDPAFPG
ncbi:LpqB family beta-propeller domain-containing protein [Actinotalea sp.]|uniref:LpqB family beta-propeller domain-containing protein n=1 Tax=Actinotalea sp. TaxID=1872145 RepID=UPI002C2235BE|nr:LpqB family beta-propeller domain-containing protein [Actinotalea sp.]HQY34394.1 LpqB family beta-propeller domain-containing protein [Actinotalea sp.]HRA49996.1 LpqB family beta-propeller domain-containing protein [Actinotalea sp.]